jgi:hypothetical protein
MTPRAQQRAAWQSRIRGGRQAPRAIHFHVAEMEFRGGSRLSAWRVAGAFESDIAAALARDGVPAHWLLPNAAAEQLHAPARYTSLAEAVLSAGKEPRK